MGLLGVFQITIFSGVIAFSILAQAYSPRSQGVVKDRLEIPLATSPAPRYLQETEIRFLMPSSDPSMRQQSLEALVGSSIAPLDWPALPRVWWKFDSYDSSARNSYVGFQWHQSRMGAGAKHTYALKYSRNIGLVLIGSIRSKDAAKRDDDIDDTGVLSVPPLAITDETSGFLYPNVREGYPMVGMCVFEISMATEDSTSFFFDILGSGYNQEKTRGFGSPFTLYSNFFQLDTEKPILSHYLKEHCEKKFEATVRPWAEKQFEEAHRAYRTEMKSECKRERHGKDRLNEGDRDCLNWHEQWGPEIRRSTVARCERGEDDLFRCQLRNREIGSFCPLTQNQDGKILPALRVGSYDDKSFACDEGMKLQCVPHWPQSTISNIESRRIMMGYDRLKIAGHCRPL